MRSELQKEDVRAWLHAVLTSTVDGMRRWLPACVVLLASCDSGATSSSPSVPQGLPADDLDGLARKAAELADAADAIEVSPDAGFRVRWCQETAEDPGGRTEVLADVALGYEATRSDDCRTRGLLPDLDALQQRNWLDYLIGYSVVMLGCPARSTPVPGGIRAFGPANTAAIGLSHPLIGRVDVETLIGQYLGSLHAHVPLLDPESDQIEAQLRITAELVIDATVAAGLSTCSSDGGL